MPDGVEPIPGATPPEATEDAAATAQIRNELAGIKVDPSKAPQANPEGWQTVDTSLGTEAVDEPLPPVAWGPNADRYKQYESDISQPAPERLDRDIIESIAGSVASSAETRLTGIDGELLNTEAADAALKSLKLERDEKVELLLLEAASGGTITKEAATTALLLDALLKQLREASLDYTKDTIKTNIPSIRENPLRRLGRNLKQGLIDVVTKLGNTKHARETIDSEPVGKNPEPTPPPPGPTQG